MSTARRWDVRIRLVGAQQNRIGLRVAPPRLLGTSSGGPRPWPAQVAAAAGATGSAMCARLIAAGVIEAANSEVVSDV